MCDNSPPLPPQPPVQVGNAIVQQDPANPLLRTTRRQELVEVVARPRPHDDFGALAPEAALGPGRQLAGASQEEGDGCELHDDGVFNYPWTWVLKEWQMRYRVW